MNELNPTQVFQLSNFAYKAAELNEADFRAFGQQFHPDIDAPTIKMLHGISGLFNPALSGFGYVARLKGIRSNELVLSTRGTLTASDWGTDLHANSTQGPTGHSVHKGFQGTFQSYIRQVESFIDIRKLGFKPTVIHCMGHSLGGALANLNAAALRELGYNTVMYTLAAPRVGQVPYAEFLSNRFSESNVFRVSNESDPVPMVSCFPYVHAPYLFGTYLLEGGALKINPMNHKIGKGYVGIQGKTWAQLKSASQARQKLLEERYFPNGKASGHYAEQLAAASGNTVHSKQFLNSINAAINMMLVKAGAVTLISVNHFGTGAFTTLDQIAEILIRHVSIFKSSVHELTGILSGIMKFLGRPAVSVQQMGITLLKWAFHLLAHALQAMAQKAIGLSMFKM